MGPPRTFSEMNGDVGRKRTFSHPLYLTPHEEFLLEFCNGGSPQKLESCPTRRCKEFDDMCVRLDTIPECGGQTDRRTDGRTLFAIMISRSAASV